MSTLALRDILVKRGRELWARPFEPVAFAGDPDADALLNDLDGNPHAFVLGCLMQRRTKVEKAWLIPHLMRERIGSFEFSVLSTLTVEKVTALMREPTPLHRFPAKMGRVFQLGVQHIAERYTGDASLIWQGRPSSAAVVWRFLEFHGAGPKIATMAANILVRDMKVPVSDTYSIDMSADVHIRRTSGRLGIVHAGATDDELIYAARELSPDYPGIFDLPLWEIGRTWCHPKAPECERCWLRPHCPSARRLALLLHG